MYRSPPGGTRHGPGKPGGQFDSGLIRRHLYQLVDHGCFVASGQEPDERFRPTLHYQILVKQLASTALYRHVQSLLESR